MDVVASSPCRFHRFNCSRYGSTGAVFCEQVDEDDRHIQRWESQEFRLDAGMRDRLIECDNAIDLSGCHYMRNHSFDETVVTLFRRWMNRVHPDHWSLLPINEENERVLTTVGICVRKCLAFPHGPLINPVLVDGTSLKSVSLGVGGVDAPLLLSGVND